MTSIKPVRNLNSVSPVNPLNTWSNEALFKELERLTLLCSNLEITLTKLRYQEQPPLNLINELHGYWLDQVAAKTKVHQYLVKTRIV